MPYGGKKYGAKVVKQKEEKSFSNKIRTLLGKDPLPKAKAKDTGFAGSRMKKKKEY